MSAPLGQVQKPTETATEMESEVATARRSRLPNWFAILWANRRAGSDWCCSRCSSSSRCSLR